MRSVVGLLTCAALVQLALADPPADVPSASPAAGAQQAPAASTSEKATPGAAQSAPPAAVASAQKPTEAPSDEDTRHFLAMGYRPEMRGHEQIYCHKETVLGSRITWIKHCGTITELKLEEQQARSSVEAGQRQGK